MFFPFHFEEEEISFRTGGLICKRKRPDDLPPQIKNEIKCFDESNEIRAYRPTLRNNTSVETCRLTATVD
jgi:hypothetical protein